MTRCWRKCALKAKADHDLHLEPGSLPAAWEAEVAGLSKDPLVDCVRSYSFTFRRRSEFVITETELKLMAAAARIGLSNRPKNG